MKLYHKTNLLAMAMTPLVFVLPDGNVVATLFNVVLGIALPVHAHIGMSGILTDYVPKFSKGALGPARFALVAVTGVTLVGLLKHNLTGDGMVKSIKNLWVKKP